MNLKNKKVLVYGLGDSGRAVIKVLREEKSHVSFFDDNIKYYEYVGFEREPEKHNYDLVVVSPGVFCRDNPLLKIFEEKKIPIISELDFAYKFCKGKIVAVTGTNGKTTVCMLANKILKTAGYNTFLCGNIGLPLSAVCKKTTKKSIIVCEVSSFQLETSKIFKANIGCITNIKPDHLDRHSSFEEYKIIKSKIAQNMKRRDVLILNLDDEDTKQMVVHKNYDYFSKKQLNKGVYVRNNQIFANKKRIIDLKDISLKGEKNLENVLCAIAVCCRFKIAQKQYEEAISSFCPASHRMQIVGTIGGATYVDDSKATNVASTECCIQTFQDKPIVLMMGGKGKEINYDYLFAKQFNFKMIVCFGEDRNRIELSAKSYGYQTQSFQYFSDAVLFCKSFAKEGDFVLLSPGCSSFDEFSSYAERGEMFKKLILERDK